MRRVSQSRDVWFYGVLPLGAADYFFLSLRMRRVTGANQVMFSPIWCPTLWELLTTFVITTHAQGDWSQASDVWSYGVLLWELLTICQSLPYARFTDLQLADTFRDRIQVKNQEVNVF
jgi:hypothetical protein